MPGKGPIGIGAQPVETLSPDGLVKQLEGADVNAIDAAFTADSPDKLNAYIGNGQYDESLADLYPPETSWIDYACVSERFVDHHQIRHKPLAGTVTYQTPPADPMGAALPLEQDTSAPTFGFTATAPDIIQQISAPSIWIQLTGFGIRMAYRVNPPRLISYGGQPAVLQYERVKEQTLGFQGGVVYRTDWDLVYMIASSPPSVPLPANPMLDLDGPVATNNSGLQTTKGHGDSGGLIMAR